MQSIEIKPCKVLPIMYGFIEIFDFDIIENTCNSTEIPPKPNRKLQVKMHGIGKVE